MAMESDRSNCEQIVKSNPPGWLRHPRTGLRPFLLASPFIFPGSAPDITDIGTVFPLISEVKMQHAKIDTYICMNVI